MRKLNNLTDKWYEYFSNHKINKEFFLDNKFGNECMKLGFVKDCNNEIIEDIDNVDDIMLLGSLIYSRWEYLNFHLTKGNVLDEKNVEWFKNAFDRMRYLLHHQRIFGTIRKIKLISNNICYGPMPKKDEEVEQHLTINSKGNVYFNSYNYNDGINYKRNRRSYFKIKENDALKIINTITSYFNDIEEKIYVMDVGTFNLIITNDKGFEFEYHGSLGFEHYYKDINISKMLKDTLNIEDIFVFD